MTPDAVADVGNSRVKWGRVAGGRVAEMVAFPHDDVLGWKRTSEMWHLPSPACWAVCGVHPAQTHRLRTWLAANGGRVLEIDARFTIDHATQTGLHVATKEPHRTGVDRLVTALAARERSPAHAPTVSICVGTAMTVDFVEADGRFVGGAILPGPRLMAKSLHQSTAKLPEVAIDPVTPMHIWGDDTADAIELGIASAILGAADQLVWDFADRPGPSPWVFVTGGDAGYFRGFRFTADLGHFSIDPLLTLDGIRLAAEATS